jgi:hypothetical protein
MRYGGLSMDDGPAQQQQQQQQQQPETKRVGRARSS